MARPVQAVAAIPLEARRFADLGALAAIRLETRRFEDIAGYQFKAMIQRVRAAEQHAAELLDGRTVWMVNSTAVGGGVSQLLRTLLPYWRGAGIDVRWMVLRGSAEFFGAPWMIVGDSRPGFCPEQGFWRPERRV